MKHRKQRTHLVLGLGLGAPLLMGLLFAGGPLSGGQPADAFGDLYELPIPQASPTGTYKKH